MAEPARVITDMAAIAATIENAERVLAQAKNNLLAARDRLNNIPTEYSDVIATINGYTPTGAHETFYKDQKAKLQTQFTALKSTLEGHLDDLGVSYS